MIKLLYYLLVAGFATGQMVTIDLSKDECKEAGFVPETLKCSTCDKLSLFNLEELMTDCQSCCIKEKELEHEKYTLAQIQYCECNIARFPQVQAFIREDMASQWGGKVKIVHVRGIRPTIVLKDNYGTTRQSLNIEKWDTNTITDFLNQWVE